MRKLLDKYNRPVPRYTSYPTVPEWNNTYDPRDYRRALQAAGKKPETALSVYMHIPFCRRRCHFCGCTTLVPNKREVVSRYLEALEREVDHIAAFLGRRREVVQLHWGGGTPTFLREDEMERLHSLIARRFGFVDGAEMAVEINPHVTGQSQVRLLRRLGFNRISLGVQDFSPDVQKAIGRGQTFTETAAMYRLLHELGFTGINFDLVYGLPRQTPAAFAETIDRVIDLRPDRIAVYSFAYLPALRNHQRAIKPSDLPTAAEKLALFAHAVERLTEAGYIQIGMDHFALPEDELSRALAKRSLHRNFMGYTTRPADDMIGLGMSAISDLAGNYAQNEARLEAYIEAITGGKLATYRGCRLSDDDLLRRRVITYFMCNLVLPFGLLNREFGLEYHDYFAAEDRRLQQFVDDGLLIRKSDRLEVTVSGRTFIRNMAAVFDSYLERRKNGPRPTYSKSV